MNALLDLAARCEAANGPDRDLDRAVALAVGWMQQTFRGCPAWLMPDGRLVSAHHLPQFTASLDAAMSLVPEGWGRIEIGQYVGGGDPGGMFWCSFTTGSLEDLAGDVDVENCATPALALTAAALRARAQTPSNGDSQ